MRLGFENHPSTWRGAIWLTAGIIALVNFRDATAVTTVLGIASAVAGGVGVAFREGGQ